MEPYAVVLVEDERIVALDVLRRLERLGYRVVAHVSTGGAAVAAARQLRPDVVLMDIGLEGAMDGIEAAERIRTCAGVPVVYLTAAEADETLERAKATEPYGYLLKPPTDQELRVAVELAVHRHRAEAERDRLRREAARTSAAPAGWWFEPARSTLTTPAGVEVPLTALEALLMAHLAERPGESVSRQALFERLDLPDDRSGHLRLEAVVSRLRRKVRALDPANEFPVRARHSLGYSFLAPLAS